MPECQVSVPQLFINKNPGIIIPLAKNLQKGFEYALITGRKSNLYETKIVIYFPSMIKRT
jgi:hypothetical protein